MGKYLVKILATRGKEKLEFDSVKEAAYAFDCRPNSIQFAATNDRKFKGWKFRKLRDGKARCLDCDIELQSQADEYCSNCYYTALTGNSMMESQKLESTNQTKIIYPAQGNE